MSQSRHTVGYGPRFAAEQAAEAKVAEAFRLIGEARGELTMGHFQRYIAEEMTALGSRGFVESIGRAILDACNRQK